MPTTPAGLPYPEPASAPDVPYWLQQLAEAIPTLTIEVGAATLAGDATNARFQDLTYATEFDTAPTVLLQVLTGATSSSTVTQAWPSNITATSMRLNVLRTNTTDVTVRWVAFTFTGTP